MARIGKDAVSGDGVLWRTGRRAGHEGVSSQDAALVFPGILSGAAGPADSGNCGWRISAAAISEQTGICEEQI